METHLINDYLYVSLNNPNKVNLDNIFDIQGLKYRE